MKRPFRKSILYYGKIIPIKTTRFPWFHKNFSGLKGWKQDFIKTLEDKIQLEESQRGYTKVLFKAFGRVVMLDSGRAELWRYPKFTYSNISIRFGWLYWAIHILRGHIYFIPDDILEKYEFLSDEETLKKVIIAGMSENEPSLVIDAMDIMLRLDYEGFRMQLRVVSKTGDRIIYTVTYPKTRVTINSVNGMQNHVLAAKYHAILTSLDENTRTRTLLHKSKMTPKQLNWLTVED